MMRSRSKRHALDKAGRDALLGRAADFLGTCPAEILAACAFGSFARAEPFRDLDVALLMATSASEPLALELSMERDLEKFVRIPVDVRILNYAPQPFQYKVIREGFISAKYHFIAAIEACIDIATTSSRGTASGCPRIMGIRSASWLRPGRCRLNFRKS